MVICPKCGNEMKHLYTEKQIKEIATTKLGELEMRREFMCTYKPCSFIKRLSSLEIMKEFTRKKSENGKSKNEIIKEVQDKIIELKEKEMKEDEKYE